MKSVPKEGREFGLSKGFLRIGSGEVPEDGGIYVSGEERLRPFKEDQGVNSVDSASDVLGLGAESIGFRMTFYNRGVLSDPNGIISG